MKSSNETAKPDNLFVRNEFHNTIDPIECDEHKPARLCGRESELFLASRRIPFHLRKMK
jgi:hypothetical protein